MKTKFLLLSVIIFYSSCTTTLNKLTGNYKSTCYIQVFPNVILDLKKDSSFSYEFAYLKEKITGNWMITGDTIYLYSKSFHSENQDSLSPKTKNTDLIDRDGYLLGKKKLFKLTRNGTTKDCFLKKND